METTTITMIAILVVIALLLVWLSLSMAATEGAVGRVTRASLNNLILEIQTDTEASQFIRDKKIKRIHKVQRLIADRYATAGSCAFFRITCNVLDGVLVAAIASLCDAPLWAGLLVGFVFALVVAVISLLVRPRSAGASKPVDLMLKHADAEQIGENKWSMPARTPIADLEEIFEIDIDEDDVDTVYGLLTKLLGRVPIVGSTAVTRGLRLTAVDSAGRRKKVSTIVVEPAHVEGVDETEQHEDHTNGAEEASHDDKDSKDKHD